MTKRNDDIIARNDIIGEFKEEVAIAIGSAIARSRREGVVDVIRGLQVEALVLSALMHEGTDASFLDMAKRSLALVRTGSVEQ